eukprot:GHVS01056056.1.p1 GENE.GHVS01056056.1~~GHVS01056056.1.p1  ORF type:complete len:638 (+),score=103.75 GHVS01056056.1:169-1914(+)
MVVGWNMLREVADKQERLTVSGMACDDIRSNVMEGDYGEAIQSVHKLLKQIVVVGETDTSSGASCCGDGGVSYCCGEMAGVDCLSDQIEQLFIKGERVGAGEVQSTTSATGDGGDDCHVQNEWQDIAVIRDGLLAYANQSASRDLVVVGFARLLSDSLQTVQNKYSHNLAAQHEGRSSLLKLLPLGDRLEEKYKNMFECKTRDIVKNVEMLNTNKSQSAEELIAIYHSIGDELRRLHRYELSRDLDELCECVLDEVELQRRSHILTAKALECEKHDKVMDGKEDALRLLQERVKAGQIEFPEPDENEWAKMCTTRQHIGSQTCDALSTRSGATGPLIVRRATDTRTDQKGGGAAGVVGDGHVDIIRKEVKRLWRNCHPVDIHTTLKKLLSSCPKLKQSVREVFLYYAKVHETQMQELVVEGLPVGLTKRVFDKFVLDLRLHPTLLNHAEHLRSFFEKFSVVPRTGRISTDGFMRVVPYHLWRPCLRELAYINLLYHLVSESQLSRSTGALPPSPGPRPPPAHLHPTGLALPLRSPSRLTAFHHFCQNHLLPLYVHLQLTNTDFAACSTSLTRKSLPPSSLS